VTAAAPEAEMPTGCDALGAFVDGELAPEAAAAYRDHLAGCDACQARLPEVMAVVGMLETGGARGEGVRERGEGEGEEDEDEHEHEHGDEHERVRGDEHVRVHGDEHVRVRGDVDGERRGNVIPMRPLDRPQARRRRQIAIVVVGAFAAAAAIAVWLIVRRGDGTGRGGDAVIALYAPGQSRPSPARFAYPGAAAYRPYDPERGGDATSGPRAFEALAALERRRDWHGIAVASMIAGDLAQAARYLALAPATPEVAIDRAALALAGTDPTALAGALVVLDGNVAPAARWNQAQILARLGLPRQAAVAFDAIAAAGEPGWADEARATAAALREAAASEAAGWRADWDAGDALVAGGPVPPPGRATARPGIYRLMFYDAVRVAPTAERVRALAPLAAELDAASGGRVLADLVERIAAVPFGARRAALAARFRAVVVDRIELDAAAQRRLLDDLRAAGPDAADLLLGALYRFGAVADHAAEYDRLAAASGDPWFVALAADQRAAAAIGRGDRAAAEATLLAAIRDARDARVHYRATRLELTLGELYYERERLAEAALVVRAAYDRARAGGEFGHVAEALPILANIAFHRHQVALAGALLGEELAADPDDCTVQRHAHNGLAQLALLRYDHAGAAAELGRAPNCDEPPALGRVIIGVGLIRHGGPGEAAVRAELDAARAGGGLDPAGVVLADVIDGALVIERDAAAGATRLEAAIARADALPDHPAARRARGWAYSLLAVHAERAGDHARALALLAADKRLAVPARCAVGVAIDDERLAVIVRGADGGWAGRFDPAWAYPGAAARPDGTPAPIVAPDLARALDGCDEVEVLARPPALGVARLLPDAIAWSYRLPPPAPATPAPAPAAPLPPLRVRVSGAVTPDALALPPLPAIEPSSTGAVVDLVGPSATPSRVLAAIAAATEIELHAHGVADRTRTDAAYLALSPDPDGDYALTPARLAGVALRGRPLVTLAACGGARGEPYLYEPDSLPAAFVRAGAVAVLASPEAVPDADATRFFAAVRARAAAGAPLAAALRDERLDWLRRDPASWTRDVLLYR
jgi:hypothetical protein